MLKSANSPTAPPMASVGSAAKYASIRLIPHQERPMQLYFPAYLRICRCEKRINFHGTVKQACIQHKWQQRCCPQFATAAGVFRDGVGRKLREIIVGCSVSTDITVRRLSTTQNIAGFRHELQLLFQPQVSLPAAKCTTRVHSRSLTRIVW